MVACSQMRARMLVALSLLVALSASIPKQACDPSESDEMGRYPAAARIYRELHRNGATNACRHACCIG